MVGGRRVRKGNAESGAFGGAVELVNGLSGFRGGARRLPPAGGLLTYLRGRSKEGAAVREPTTWLITRLVGELSDNLWANSRYAAS